MPRLTVCSHPGCPELIPIKVGKCDEHAPPPWQRPSRHTLERPGDWKRRRAKVMRRDGGLCVRCGRQGSHVDHIIPVARGGSWGMENLQTLCRECHSFKTKQDRRSA